MVEPILSSSTRRMQRVRRRRHQRLAAIPRALVLLGLAAVTIIAPPQRICASK